MIARLSAFKIFSQCARYWTWSSRGSTAIPHLADMKALVVSATSSSSAYVLSPNRFPNSSSFVIIFFALRDWRGHVARCVMISLMATSVVLLGSMVLSVFAALPPRAAAPYAKLELVETLAGFYRREYRFALAAVCLLVLAILSFLIALSGFAAASLYNAALHRAWARLQVLYVGLDIPNGPFTFGTGGGFRLGHRRLVLVSLTETRPRPSAPSVRLSERARRLVHQVHDRGVGLTAASD